MFDLSAFSLVGYCKLISSKVHIVFKFQLTIYDDVDDLHFIFDMTPETLRHLICSARNKKLYLE